MTSKYAKSGLSIWLLSSVLAFMTACDNSPATREPDPAVVARLQRRSDEIVRQSFDASPGIRAVAYVADSEVQNAPKVQRLVSNAAPDCNFLIVGGVPMHDDAIEAIGQRFGFLSYVYGETGGDTRLLIAWSPHRFQIVETFELSLGWKKEVRDVGMPLISQFVDRFTKETFFVANVCLDESLIESLTNCAEKLEGPVLAFNSGKQSLRENPFWQIQERVDAADIELQGAVVEVAVANVSPRWTMKCTSYPIPDYRSSTPVYLDVVNIPAQDDTDAPEGQK